MTNPTTPPGDPIPPNSTQLITTDTTTTTHNSSPPTQQNSSISTFLEATERNFFVTWPNLTPQVIRRYLQPSVATAKGHLNQQRQRRRKPFYEETPPTPITTRTHTIYAAILDRKQPTGNSFSDLTGRFPIQSNRGANYIFVLYDYDSNAIIVRPLRNHSAQEIQRVFTSVHAYLVARGLRPRLHTLDNEASTSLKDFLTAENVEYQLVPRHIHQRNSAERAIQTFKNHFVAELASTDPNFPLSNWCRLLPQAELTLNLLRPSRLKTRRRLRFHPYTTSPTGHPCHCPRKTNSTSHFGPARCRWMVHWSLHGPLPMLPHMDPIYPCQMHSGYSPIFSNRP